MNAADYERAKQLLSCSSEDMPFSVALTMIGSAMQAGQEDVAKTVVQLPQFQNEEQQCRLLMLAVQHSWPGLVKHLLTCGVRAPQNILSHVRDTATLEALLAGVPEEQHAELANHACAYGGLSSCLGKLLLRQYREQWRQKQQLEQLKLGAQHILIAALTTQKQAAELMQEAQAAAAAAAGVQAMAAPAAVLGTACQCSGSCCQQLQHSTTDEQQQQRDHQHQLSHGV